MPGNPLALLLQASVDEKRDEVLEPETLAEQSLPPTFGARASPRVARK